MPDRMTSSPPDSALQGWQPIAGYDDYEVSALGEVRKCGDVIVGQWSNTDGYRLVRVSKPRAMLRVHRLVATAFIPNPAGKPFVNHIDCDRANNRADNLEWCTQRENLAHAARLGRMQRDYWVGRRSPNASLSDEQAAAIRSAYASGSLTYQALSGQFGISKRAVGRLLKGETYAC